MKVVKHTLSNGLKAVIVEMPDSEVVSTSVYVGAGGRYENPKIYGLSHFLEHMAFKGTHKYPSSKAFADVIESIGGKQNAWTSHDHTGYWNIVPRQHRLIAFDTIAEQLSSLILDEKEIDKERGVIIEEINMTYDDPAGVAWHKFGETMWPDQAIGTDLLGTKEHIAGFKREDFIDYMKPLYVSKNMTLCVAGGVKAPKVIEELEEVFIKVPFGERIRPKEIQLDQYKSRTKTFYKETNQSHLILGYKTFSQYDKRRYALDLLIAILGSGAGSVLFREIREKQGLAYAIYIISDYYTEYGNMAIYSGLNKTKTGKALQIIKTEVEKAKTRLFSENDLKRAKEFVKGGYIISLENAKNLSNWYAEREFLDPEKPSPKEILDIFDKITPGEIQAAAEAVFRPEHETLVVVGPFKNERKFAKILDESNK